MFLPSEKKGFTLIELMVSVSIFALVMTISMGAILSVLNANQKSQTLRSVVDNLNATLESMTRTIRFGTNYVCGDPGDAHSPNCAGDSTFTVIDSDGRTVVYSLSDSHIMRSIDGEEALALTSPEVEIQSLAFTVTGALPLTDSGYGTDAGTPLQPKVVILIKGRVVGKGATGSAFTLQTTVSERQLDK